MRSGNWLSDASEWGPVIEEIRGFAKQTAGFHHNPAQPAADRQFPREQAVFFYMITFIIPLLKSFYISIIIIRL